MKTLINLNYPDEFWSVPHVKPALMRAKKPNSIRPSHRWRSSPREDALRADIVANRGSTPTV